MRGRELTTEEYKDRWINHINVLKRMGWYAPDMDTIEEIDDIIDELKNILNKCAENREK